MKERIPEDVARMTSTVMLRVPPSIEPGGEHWLALQDGIASGFVRLLTERANRGKPDLDQIARIIDPYAFEDVEDKYLYAIRNGHDEDYARRFSESDDRRGAARARASAILALLATPAPASANVVGEPFDEDAPPGYPTRTQVETNHLDEVVLRLSRKIETLERELDEARLERQRSSREWRDTFDAMHRRAMDAEREARDASRPDEAPDGP